MLTLYLNALRYRLSKEIYGQKIVDLVLGNDLKSLNALKWMLSDNKWLDNDENEIYSLVHETIAKKVSNIRKNAPPLESFLPDNLPDEVRDKMVRLLKNQNTDDAKLYSDAVMGKFRVLSEEFRCDWLNELEKLQAGKRQPPTLQLHVNSLTQF